MRLAGVVLLVIGAGLVHATWMLFDLGETWVAKAVALLITEPLAAACILSSITFLAPESFAARWFESAVRRAGFVALALIFIVASGIVGMTVWALYGYITSR